MGKNKNNNKDLPHVVDQVCCGTSGTVVLNHWTQCMMTGASSLSLNPSCGCGGKKEKQAGTKGRKEGSKEGRPDWEKGENVGGGLRLQSPYILISYGWLTPYLLGCWVLLCLHCIALHCNQAGRQGASLLSISIWLGWWYCHCYYPVTQLSNSLQLHLSSSAWHWGQVPPTPYSFSSNSSPYSCSIPDGNMSHAPLVIIEIFIQK